MVAVGTVDGAENRIQALSNSESLLNTSGGDGHGVARLVTSATRPAIGAHALEKGPRQIDAAPGCAVSFGGAGGIQEKRAVWYKSDLASANRDNDGEYENDYQDGAKKTAATETNEPVGLAKKATGTTHKGRSQSWEGPHRNTPNGAVSANFAPL